MSNRYKGGVISATPPTTTGGNDGVASGAWTLEQQMQLQAAGLWPNQPIFYIEDVFSTYLYTGNETARSITNNIDLSTKGGMVWIKDRDNAIRHAVFDSARAAVNYFLIPNSTAAQNVDFSNNVTSFNADGFSLGTGSSENGTGRNYVSWTFRKQPKFFDVVTYTGSGAALIPHNLGSVPGTIIVKCTSDGSTNWAVYHRSLGATKYILLNETDAEATSSAPWNNTEPTSTNFSVGSSAWTGQSGRTYVAYLFAHNAGGFGLTGTDNVISCGSFSAPSGNATVTIGYEPQYILWKRTDASQNWNVYDNMRGWAQKQVAQLYPNLTQVEDIYTGSEYFFPTATGFQLNSSFGLVGDYIYITIRRGPMKVPTSATTVFSPITNSATTGTVNTTGFPVDMGIVRWRDGEDSNYLRSRLQGVSSTTAESGAWLRTNSDDPETSTGGLTRLWNNTGLQTTSGYSGYSTVYWNFGRAPGFFDEVCYTGNSASSGTGNTQLISHNLTVPPEMIIVKRRNSNADWVIWTSALSATQYMFLDSGAVLSANPTFFFGTTGPTPSATQFKVGDAYYTNASGSTYAAYLFATVAGVSKVGSYTGTGATQTINCGFAAGSRFVMIKRTDSTGAWYVWDSARGIVAGNDPYLLLNSPVVEVTNTDYVDTAATGFEISSTAPAAINASGGSYIFLAIA
jgi:hypothetical protein